jgi:hypothetical protein
MGASALAIEGSILHVDAMSETTVEELLVPAYNRLRATAIVSRPHMGIG